MNRKAKRALTKKLGEDFPLDQMLALMEYYGKFDLSIEDFFIFLLKKYIPIEYKRHVEDGVISYADKQ